MSNDVDNRKLVTLIGGLYTYYGASKGIIFYGNGKGHEPVCHQHSTLEEAIACEKGKQLPILVEVLPRPKHGEALILPTHGQVIPYDFLPEE